MIEKKISTRFSQDPLVGVQCRVIRGLRASHARTAGIDSSDVRVVNLGGPVALNGTVPSLPQYLEAATVARRIAGVTSVDNHLAVRLPPPDYRDDPR
jgi:hypothetical protein